MAQEMLAVAACCMGFWFGCVALPPCIEPYNRLRMAVHVQQSMDPRKILSQHPHRDRLVATCLYLVRNGVGWSMPAATWCCQHEIVRHHMNKAILILQMKGLESSSVHVCSCGLALGICVGGIIAVLARSLVSGVVSVVVMLWIAQLVLARADAKREEILRRQVPDAMRSLCACFQAGYSIPQAFMATSRESQSPTKELFARVSQDIEVGRPVSEALRIFKQASGISELGFVAIALDVQHISGGSVIPVLESAEQSVTKSLEMRRFLRTQTAQARFSAHIVSGLPVVLLLLLSLVSPGFMDPFVHSFQGMVLVAIAVGLQIIGVVWIRRLLALEVD